MNNNIKLLIEFHLNFIGNDIILDVDTRNDAVNDYIFLYKPKSTVELKQIIIERFKLNPEKPYLLDIDTSLITDMSLLFLKGFGSLNKLAIIQELDLSTWDTSNVTDMHCMFLDCGGLKKLNLSSFNTSRVNDMRAMFYGCNDLTSLDLRVFNTSIVSDVTGMFCNCTSLTSLDLSSFNTINVKKAAYMFSECENLTDIDFSNLVFKSDTNINKIVSKCPRKTLNLFKKQVTIIN